MEEEYFEETEKEDDYKREYQGLVEEVKYLRDVVSNIENFVDEKISYYEENVITDGFHNVDISSQLIELMNSLKTLIKK